MELMPHELLHQTHRQIAPDQIIAIECVLSACNELLRNPIIPIYGTLADPRGFNLQRTKNFHDIVDSITGTHVRDGMLNCEACKIIYTIAITQAYMLCREAAWYQRIKDGESFTALAILEQTRNGVLELLSSTRTNTQRNLDDYKGSVAFLRWLEQRLREGHSGATHGGPVAQSLAHGGNVSIVNAPVFNNPPVDLTPLAEAQKYGFDTIRSALETSRQPPATQKTSPGQRKSTPCTQAQKAKMFGVDEKTIRNWESGKTAAPSGYDVGADQATLEAMGRLYQAQKVQRSQARELNRGDYRDYNRQGDTLDSDDPAEIAAWNEEQNRK